MKQNKKPARWEFLNELDGRPTDTTPIRAHGRKPYTWEILLYAAAGLLWGAALTLAVLERYGTATLTAWGVFALCLRWAVFELQRRKRCKSALLGQVESFTRRRVIRKAAKYPVIHFEAGSTSHLAYGARPAHLSTKGNEVWVRYNPATPADAFLSSDSTPKLSVGLALVTAILGAAFLIMELN